MPPATGASPPLDSPRPDHLYSDAESTAWGPGWRDMSSVGAAPTAPRLKRAGSSGAGDDATAAGRELARDKPDGKADQIVQVSPPHSAVTPERETDRRALVAHSSLSELTRM